ncbi:gpW family head-tail joining protein [Mesorhizobium sp.]|uniref:gpW family head-tail joining protein n=1 Tax=Mesorhizobium sp. TaxID=1871066 RepID=UPI000FE98518|nr:gpW family head-tail joining protein [Mesorhizobium sp.]RWP29849.1 MAG: phage tail protein [Mesorhizobium sp.]
MVQVAVLLSEAKAAYHRLMIGEAAVEIRDSNGETIRYTSANASRLKAYIAELEQQLAGTTAAARLPLRPMWG